MIGRMIMRAVQVQCTMYGDLLINKFSEINKTQNRAKGNIYSIRIITIYVAALVTLDFKGVFINGWLFREMTFRS